MLCYDMNMNIMLWYEWYAMIWRWMLWDDYGCVAMMNKMQLSLTLSDYAMKGTFSLFIGSMIKGYSHHWNHWSIWNMRGRIPKVFLYEQGLSRG